MCYNDTEHWISYGPTFGYDLYIYNYANKNKSSFTDIGFSYEIPPRQPKIFLSESKYFKVLDNELFHIIW